MVEKHAELTDEHESLAADNTVVVDVDDIVDTINMKRSIVLEKLIVFALNKTIKHLHLM